MKQLIKEMQACIAMLEHEVAQLRRRVEKN